MKKITNYQLKYKRVLEMDLPRGQSAFLWGARRTGKSTYLQDRFPHSIRYDLLKTEIFTWLLKRPQALREEIQGLSDSQLIAPIIIDEVQKIPILLDEVHWMIENTNAYFILCGSSARKLKRGAANLLGGRAWRFTFYPLVYPEIPNIDLLKALNYGLLPSHYNAIETDHLSLASYVQDYLREEIMAEGLTRNLQSFSYFLDSVGYSNGELVNYSNIARDCGVDAKTVRAYYDILVDTLVGYYVYPYRKKKKRDIITQTPKFYLFDVGVAGALAKRHISELRGAEAGKAFEHYILMELVAYVNLKSKQLDITYWRTNKGLEVDFILGDREVAIEVKINSSPEKRDIKGLLAFHEEHQPQKSIVVCTGQRARVVTVSEVCKVHMLPWQDFLEQLWEGRII